MSSQSPYLMRAVDVIARAQSFSCPWNGLLEIHGTTIGRLLGLKRMDVDFMCVPPGRESPVYHLHQREEEQIYILSGETQTEIDDNIFIMRSGDSMVFPTGIVHHLRNRGKDDPIYLCDGEHLNIEIADFPRLDKRMLHHGEQMDIVDTRPQWEPTSLGT